MNYYTKEEALHMAELLEAIQATSLDVEIARDEYNAFVRSHTEEAERLLGAIELAKIPQDAANLRWLEDGIAIQVTALRRHALTQEGATDGR